MEEETIHIIHFDWALIDATIFHQIVIFQLKNEVYWFRDPVQIPAPINHLQMSII